MKRIGKENVYNRNVWLKKTLKNIPPGKKILDVGAGECPYTEFCNHLEYTSQDFCKYTNKKDNKGLHHKKWDETKIDIISDITSIPVLDNSFDAIMCIEVLEHVPNPLLAIKEMHRVLKNKGKLILTAPFSSLIHFSPFHYYTGFSYNFYKYHLLKLGFKILDISYNGNYYEYMAQELRRLPKIATQYSNIKINKKQGSKIKEVLSILDNLNKKDNASSELLCYGLHVIAIKEK
ncbi:MAG: class I SAM-dependent methyltransferase [archaeon]